MQHKFPWRCRSDTLLLDWKPRVKPGVTLLNTNPATKCGPTFSFSKLVGVFLCMFWQFGAKLARVESTAQWSQQKQQQQQRSSLLPQSVYKRVSNLHSSHKVPVEWKIHLPSFNPVCVSCSCISSYIPPICGKNHIWVFLLKIWSFLWLGNRGISNVFVQQKCFLDFFQKIFSYRHIS